MRHLIIFSFLFLIFFGPQAQAQTSAPCAVQDRPCIMNRLAETANQIEEAGWRDQTYRELAKTLAFENRMDDAIALIDKIENPDTKAMTIRGIGMAAADLKLQPEGYDALFAKLRQAAEKIAHPPSYAIALTYIAMAQAFAGEDEAAWATAADMQNQALRNKAYGESGEIQAERGDLVAAGKSIGFIDDPGYRSKAWLTIAKIFADRGYLKEALAAASSASIPYQRAEGLQYVLDAQKPREVKK